MIKQFWGGVKWVLLHSDLFTAWYCKLFDHAAYVVEIEGAPKIFACERCLWWTWEDDPDNNWFDPTDMEGYEE